MLEWLKLLGAAALVVSVALLAEYFTRRSPLARRRLRGVRRSTTDALTVGDLVKVVGKLSADINLQAPLSGAKCVAFSIKVFDSGADNDVVTLADENDSIAFSIQDERGTIVVHPFSFRLLAHKSSQLRHRKKDGPFPDSLVEYLERLANAGKAQGALKAMGSTTSFAHEEAIRDGTTVAVWGLVESYVTADGQKLLRLTCPNDAPLLISDEPSTFGD